MGRRSLTGGFVPSSDLLSSCSYACETSILSGLFEIPVSFSKITFQNIRRENWFDQMLHHQCEVAYDKKLRRENKCHKKVSKVCHVKSGHGGNAFQISPDIYLSFFHLN